MAPVAGSDAHRADLIGRARTRFPGRTAADLRAAIETRTTTWEGEGYAWTEQLGMFRRQTAKNLRAARDEGYLGNPETARMFGRLGEA